jgi:pyrimidine-specific ribonucleoside hydrolase
VNDPSLRALVSAILSVTVGATACTSAEPGSPEPSGSSPDTFARRPVVVDTDVGADDAMALLFALRDPTLDVRAVTVIGTGLAHCEPGMRNARALLALAGAAEVPVACGPTEPLAGDAAFPEEWRAAADGFFGLEAPVLAGDLEEPPDLSAAGLLAQILADEPEPVDVLALGPLTTLGGVLGERPELADQIGRIVIMGGAIDVAGNVLDNAVAEWNLFIDPSAANLVLRAGVPITLVPLDATDDAPVTEFFVRELEASPPTPEIAWIRDLLAANPSFLDGRYFFWDPLAAVVLADEAVARFEPMGLSVIDEGDPLLRGWARRAEDGPEIRVAVEADVVAFESRFLSTLAGEPVDATRPQPDLVIRESVSGCTYEGPDTVPAGEVVVRVEADESPDLFAVVAELLRSRTYEDLVAFVDAGGAEDAEPPGWIRLAGSAGLAPNGGPGLALWNLTPGAYALLCATRSPVPVAPLEVTG